MILRRSLAKGLVASTLAAILVSGCGAGEDESATSTTSSASSDLVNDTAAESPASGGAQAKGAGAPMAPTAQLIQAASAVPRKIIYNATVDLIADNFASAQSNLLGLIQRHGGYLAETNIGGTPGTPRQGTWKIRVPENQFEAFMGAVVKLGELQTTQTDSQDVTAEFYDLQARISNKQVEEKAPAGSPATLNR
jgi:hypothetical protein